jgi:hypothetical protein
MAPTKKLLQGNELKLFYDKISIIHTGLQTLSEILFFFDGTFIEKSSIRPFQNYFNDEFVTKLTDLIKKGSDINYDRNGLYQEFVGLYEDFVYWDIVLQRLNADNNTEFLDGNKKNCRLWTIDLKELNENLSDLVIIKKLKDHGIKVDVGFVLKLMNQCQLYDELSFLKGQSVPKNAEVSK